MAETTDSLLLLSHDAAILAKNKAHLPRGLSISIKGKITALSELTRMKNDWLFLIELESVFILVKDFHLAWHEKLVPLMVYCFYDLRLTTLEKGTATPCPVFMVWHSSSFFCLGDQDVQTDPVPASLQEWLHNTKMTEILSIDCAIMDHFESDGHDEKLVTYEGIVTSVEQAENAIVFLDNNVRLVMTLCSLRRVDLMLGCKVTVYNAHPSRDQSGIVLACCMKTYVKISGDGGSNTQPDSTELPKALADQPCSDHRTAYQNQDIKNYDLNLKEIMVITHLRDKLTALKKSVSQICKIVPSFLKSELCPSLEKSTWSLLDTFFYHKKVCPLMPSKEADCRLPEILDLSNVKGETVSSLSLLTNAAVPGLANNTQPEISQQHHSYWKLYEHCGVLVGCISTTCSGLVIFDDGSEKMLVIVLPRSSGSFCRSRDESLSAHGMGFEEHVCTQMCVRDYTQGQKLICPVLDAHLTGKTICVTKFHILIEEHEHVQNLTKSKLIDGQAGCDRQLCYLAFSLCDCVLLDQISVIPGVQMMQPSKKYPKPPSHLEDYQCSSCLVFVTRKLPIIDLSGSGDSQLRIEGVKLDFCSVFPMLNRDSTKSSECCSNTDPALTLGSCNKSVTKFPNRAVSFLFKKSTAHWYGFITSDQLYKFSVFDRCEDGGAFVPAFSIPGVEKVVNHPSFRAIIEVPEGVHIERLIPDRWKYVMDAFSEAKLVAIEDLLSHSVTESLVSFQGIIMGKEYMGSSSSTSARRGVLASTRIQVRELTQNRHVECGSEPSMDVYLDFARSISTFGLLPGAVIEFHCLERKVSRRSKVYCRFIALSSAKVIAFSSMETVFRWPSSSSSGHAVSVDSLKREFLINIWLGVQQWTGPWRVGCWVCRVFRLSLKAVCPVCRGMFFQRSCQNRGCANSMLAEIVTNTVILVEDGTCQSSVRVWGPTLVRQVLTLTEQQWTDLTDEVKTCGEIVISNTTQMAQESPLTCFLHQLIRSPLVSRPCVLAVTRPQSSPISSTVAMMAIHEFQEKKVKAGKTWIKTLTLPLLQLDCIAIQELDA